MEKTFLKVGTGLLLSTIVMGAVLIVSSGTAFAHGYVESPKSRAYQAQLDSTSMGWEAAIEKYGSVISEPQGLEAPKGFPINGPADGQIASANGKFGGIMDRQTSTYWKKQPINTGVNSFTWAYTAEHDTSQWHYYMTKQGWDQNAPLNRNELELIGTIKHDGSGSKNNLTHSVKIPDNRSGYNVILAVWDVSNTGNAFYQVIDVDVKNDGIEEPTPITPEAPTQLKASNVTASELELSWEASSNVKVKEYNIYRNGEKVSTISGTTFIDSALTDNTKYSYQVEAVSFDNKKSEKSLKLDVTTKEIPVNDDEKPTAPTGVHSMGTTDSSVELMWKKATHTIGIKEYQVYRDGKKISSTNKTAYTDETVASNTTYRYTIKAVSVSGNVSEASEVFQVTTKDAVEEIPADNAWVVGTFTNPVEYKVGQVVSHKGKTYKTINGHLNYGDENWAPGIALSLFKEIPTEHVWIMGSLTKPVEYKKGQVVSHKGKRYKTITTHLNYGDTNWAPDKAATLFGKIK